MCVCDDGFKPIKTMVGCILKVDVRSDAFKAMFDILFVTFMYAQLFLLYRCVLNCTKEKATKQTNPEEVAKKPIAASTPALAADSAPKPSN